MVRSAGASVGTMKRLPCQLCNKVLTSQWNFSRHLRMKHGVDISSIRASGSHRYECCHETCKAHSVRFHAIGDYRKHLENEHNVKGMSVPMELTFDSFDDFLTWKEEQERKDMAKFVKCRGVKQSGQRLVWRYECNRSGTYKPKGSGRRQLKSQGSCKTGHRCPAAIVVISKDGKFEVSYHTMHYGHEKMIGHLSLPSSVKQHIADQLAQGVSTSKILQDIRLSAGGNMFDRSHLLTRKDLHNIKQAFRIKRGSSGGTCDEVIAENTTGDLTIVELPSDSLGLCDWVQGMQSLATDSPVVFYRQNEAEPEVGAEPEAGAEPAQEFFLVLMNPLQKKMCQRFGNDRICVDSTYHVSGYDYDLTTLLVVDDYEEGFPVAFLLSTSVDSDVLTEFFTTVRTVTGDLNPMCFISDDTTTVYSAWSSVMGPSSKRQQYTQLVHRNCYNKMSKIGGDKYRRQAVSKALRTCHSTLQYIKHSHLEAGQVGNVDKCCDALCSFVVDKQFNRLTKLHRGKLSSKLSSIVQRHTEGAILACNCVMLDNGRWHAQSDDDCGCLVEKYESHSCTEACVSVCKQCEACPLKLSCTCEDYLVYGNLCKHMHGVCIRESRVSEDLIQQSSSGTMDDAIHSEAQEEIQLYMSCLRTKGSRCGLETVQKLLREISSMVCDRQRKYSSVVLLDVVEHLKSVVGLMSMREDSTKEETATSQQVCSIKNEPMTDHEASRPMALIQGSAVHETKAGADWLEQVAPVSTPAKRRGRPPSVKNNVKQIKLTKDVKNNGFVVGSFASDLNVKLGVRTYVSGSQQQMSPSSELISDVIDVKDVITSCKQLTDRHVETAVLILRQQFPGVLGLESPVVGRTGFAAQTNAQSLVVQVHQVAGEHSPAYWVTSVRGPGDPFVTVYDSHTPLDMYVMAQVSPSLQSQLAQVYRCTEREITVLFPEMSFHAGAEDSALYALATATDVCVSDMPSQREYDYPRMRSHLLHCLSKRHFEPFPGVYVERLNNFLITIPVYCYCRRPGDDCMVECVQCAESFHCRCVQYTGGDFKCVSCGNDQKLDYVADLTGVQIS